MSLSKLFMVARWEFTEKVRTKAFIIALFVTPLISISFTVLPFYFVTKESNETKVFAVYDGTEQITKSASDSLTKKFLLKDGKPMYRIVPATGTNMDKVISDYKQRILNEEFEGIFVIPPSIDKDRKLTYYSTNVANEIEIYRISNEIENIFITSELIKNKFDIAKYQQISKSIKSELIKITQDGTSEESNIGKQYFSAFFAIFLIFILITTTGQALVRSLLEEKSNRIMEVLLSSCSSTELMFGKLLGLGGLGLVQGAVWGCLAIGVSTQFPLGFSLTDHLPITLLFAVLGYLFYAALMIGIGSTATTEQEAQNITGYIIMFAVMPMVLIMALLKEPNGTLAKVLTYIPFLTPSIMAARISIETPDMWEILLSIVVMLISIAVVIKISSKVFTVGILSYGKRLTLAEVWHLLKAKS